MYNISLLGIVTLNPPHNEYILIKILFKKFVILQPNLQCFIYRVSLKFEI
jgi:hypothetical protein